MGFEKKRLGQPLHVDMSKEQKELLEKFLRWLAVNKKAERTLEGHQYRIKKFLSIAGKSFHFKKATKQDLEDILGTLETYKLAPETKRKIGVSIKLFYKWLLGDGEEYPKLVRWIKTADNGSKTMLPEDLLSIEEIQRLIEKAKYVRDKAIIALLYDTGIRCGELMNLRIKDVSLDSDMAHITVSGKTGMRKIPIVLSAPYMAQYLETIKFIENPDSPLWVTTGNGMQHGKPITKSTIGRVLYEAATGAGIKKRIYPHLFRHSRATVYANQITEQQLKMYMGWSANSRMASTYVHMSGRDIDRAIAKANGIVLPDDKENEKSFRACPRCKYRNGLTNIHCAKCGLNLDVTITAENFGIIDEKTTQLRELLVKMMSDPEFMKETLDKYGKRHAKKA